MPIDLIYDLSVETTPSTYAKCIHASEGVFRLVSGILHKIATEKPDSAMSEELKGFLKIDHETQGQILAFALACLTATLCGESDEEMPVYHRTKPTDTCVLQELQGEEWVDIFDFGACLARFFGEQEDQTYQQEQEVNNAVKKANDIMADYNTKYTGTSHSFHPSLVMGGPGVPEMTALCHVLKSIVEKYANDSARLKQAEAENYDRASLAIALGVGLVAVVGALAAIPSLGASIPVAASLSAFLTTGTSVLGGAVVGLTGVGLSAWAQHIRDTDLAVFQDNDAIRAVACQWYDQRNDQSGVAKEDYQEPIDTTGMSANAAALATAIQPLINQDLSYAVFLNMWRDDIAARGLMPQMQNDCACEATVVIIGVTGKVTYEGLTDGFDTYLFESQTTGHYVTFAAHSEGNVPWKIIDVEVPGNSGEWVNSVINWDNAYRKPDEITDLMQDHDILFQGRHDLKLRVVVMPA